MGAAAATGIVLVSGVASRSPGSIIPTVITVTGYDANGELVMQDYDADPISRFDIWNSGPGDANFDGVCDLTDLNIVLSNMGREYR